MNNSIQYLPEQINWLRDLERHTRRYNMNSLHPLVIYHENSSTKSSAETKVYLKPEDLFEPNNNFNIQSSLKTLIPCFEGKSIRATIATPQYVPCDIGPVDIRFIRYDANGVVAIRSMEDPRTDHNVFGTIFNIDTMSFEKFSGYLQIMTKTVSDHYKTRKIKKNNNMTNICQHFLQNIKE